MNKLADLVLQAWLDALNELTDMGVISDHAADALFDNAILHAKSIAKTEGLEDELNAFVTEAPAEPLANEAVFA